MDNPDLVCLVAHHCQDLSTITRLSALNKHVHQAMAKHMRRLRFDAARNRIRGHVAELPSRLGLCKDRTGRRTWYTIIKKECVVQVQVMAMTRLDGSWAPPIIHTTIVPRPLGIKARYRFSGGQLCAAVLARRSWFGHLTLCANQSGWSINLNVESLAATNRIFDTWHNKLALLYHLAMGHCL